MKKTSFLLPLGIFLIALAAGLAFFQSKSKFGVSHYVELDWRDLAELEYTTGEAPEKLKQQDQKEIRIPGFMVPLEDNQKEVTEFLLVPSPQACIHVPPPPPNQMVYVHMEEGAKYIYGPIWVYGEFHIMSKRHMYGESSFTMKGLKVEQYR